MRFNRRRLRASIGLIGAGILAAGLQALPQAATKFKEQPQRFKPLRAGMRGAVYVGEAGVVLQQRGNDCGAACLTMVLSSYGIEAELADLGRRLRTTGKGVSLLRLRLLAERLGLPARSWVISDADLRTVPLPIIAFIGGDHYVVIRRIVAPELLVVDDPAIGRLEWPLGRFRRLWHGAALVFDPSWLPSRSASDSGFVFTVINHPNQKGARTNGSNQ